MPSVFRVGGGYTSFRLLGVDLPYVINVRDSAPSPVASPEVIQPLNAVHPVEIAFPKAHGAGTLNFTLKEEWDQDIWERIPDYAGAANIIEVFNRSLADGVVTTCSKLIRDPNGRTRGTIYHGAKIVAIDETEDVNVSTMTLSKSIQIMYTHRTKG